MMTADGGYRIFIMIVSKMILVGLIQTVMCKRMFIGQVGTLDLVFEAR